VNYKDFAAQEIDKALAALGSGPDGLTDAAAVV